ncbi:hypothetical protein WMF38_12575 [Sorangium sp. So ce118]
MGNEFVVANRREPELSPRFLEGLNPDRPRSEDMDPTRANRWVSGVENSHRPSRHLVPPWWPRSLRRSPAPSPLGMARQPESSTRPSVSCSTCRKHRRGEQARADSSPPHRDDLFPLRQGTKQTAAGHDLAQGHPRRHSLYRQGLYWYHCIPTMREEWLRRLVDAFDRIVREHAFFSHFFEVK